MLRGVNHSGFVDVPDGAWDAPGQPLYSGIGRWDPEVVRQRLDEYHQLRFNALRLHTVVQWWKDNPRSYRDPWRSVTYSAPYRQMIKDVIKSAQERGLYVIFNSTVYPSTYHEIPDVLRWGQANIDKVHGLVFITYRTAVALGAGERLVESLGHGRILHIQHQGTSGRHRVGKRREIQN